MIDYIVNEKKFTLFKSFFFLGNVRIYLLIIPNGIVGFLGNSAPVQEKVAETEMGTDEAAKPPFSCMNTLPALICKQ